MLTTDAAARGKSYQIFVASNNAMPKSSKSLPSLSPRAVLTSNNVQKISFGEKLGNSVEVLHKAGGRTTKIYLSEKQSRDLMGIPAVPPGTPFLGKCIG